MNPCPPLSAETPLNIKQDEETFINFIIYAQRHSWMLDILTIIMSAVVK